MNYKLLITVSIVIVIAIALLLVNIANTSGEYYKRRDECVVTEYEANGDRDRIAIHDYCRAKARLNEHL